MAISKEERYRRNKIWRNNNKDKLRETRSKNTWARYVDLRARAARSGRKFNIAYSTYDRMIRSGCFYCGASLMDEIGGSLDRVVNKNYSYVTRNVVPCCTKCNLIKSKYLSKDETILIMEMLNRLKSGDKDVVEVLRVTKEVKEAKRKSCINRGSSKRRRT